MPNRAISFGRPRPAVLVSLLAALVMTACSSSDDDGDGEDNTAPTVSVSVPSGAAFRTVTVTASATDNRGVSMVEFLIDGTVAGSDASAPYEFAVDTANLAEGDHAVTARATDAAGNVATSAAATLTVQNDQTFDVALASAQENPPTGSAATGTASLEVNVATGAASGSATVTGMTSTAAHIHDAYAGRNGGVVVGFEPRAGTPETWDLPAGTVLTTAQVDRLLAGALYVNAHSTAFPNGEVRGQILPDNVSVYFVDLSDDQEIEQVRSEGSGRAALTVNHDSRAAVAHVALDEIDATAVHLSQGEAGTEGPVALDLTQDNVDPAHWSAESGVLTQAVVDALAQGGVHFDVDTAAHPSGEIRGQVTPPGVYVGFARLDGVQVLPAVDSSGQGTGAITVNENTDTATIHVTTSGLTSPTGAQLRSGFGGREGASITTLTQDGSDPAHWSASGRPVSAADISAFKEGGLYAEVATQANADGEIRGQLMPPGMLFIANRLEGAQEVPARTTAARGTAAVTVDRTTRGLVLHANTSGVDDANAAHIHTAYAGANGGVTVPLTKDAADPTHWSASGVTLLEEQLHALEHGRMYVNVHTPANPGGEIRGQLVSDLVQVEFNMLSGAEEVPPVTTTATGTSATTVDFDEYLVSINVHTTGVDDAHMAHIHRGPRGENGPVLVGLTQNPNDPGHWAVENHTITEEDVGEFLDGRWYVNVHTPAHQGGEIRAQIGPEEPPPDDTTDPTATLGAVPATVSGTVTLTATADDNVGVTRVRFLLNGTTVIGNDTTAPYSVAWDTTAVPNGQVSLTAEARDAAGNTGTSTAVTTMVSNATAVTLTQLQTTIFSPRCSACHTGGGGSLPASMNLSSAGATFAALVNVASEQKPSLMRVAPGNSAASYVVHKLEGGPDIEGGRMPFGGPFLSTAEVNSVKSWIDSGAPNN